jgi:hypothetical protein
VIFLVRLNHIFLALVVVVPTTRLSFVCSFCICVGVLVKIYLLLALFLFYLSVCFCPDVLCFSFSMNFSFQIRFCPFLVVSILVLFKMNVSGQKRSPRLCDSSRCVLNQSGKFIIPNLAIPFRNITVLHFYKRISVFFFKQSFETRL